MKKAKDYGDMFLDSPSVEPDDIATEYINVWGEKIVTSGICSVVVNSNSNKNYQYQ